MGVSKESVCVGIEKCEVLGKHRDCVIMHCDSHIQLSHRRVVTDY